MRTTIPVASSSDSSKTFALDCYPVTFDPVSPISVVPVDGEISSGPIQYLQPSLPIESPSNSTNVVAASVTESVSCHDKFFNLTNLNLQSTDQPAIKDVSNSQTVQENFSSLSTINSVHLPKKKLSPTYLGAVSTLSAGDFDSELEVKYPEQLMYTSLLNPSIAGGSETDSVKKSEVIEIIRKNHNYVDGVAIFNQ